VKPAEETQLFARLATEPKLREWLQEKLQGEFEIFINALDKEYLTKAQGRAGLLQMLIKKLDEGRKAS
jgi:hypothetical protein